MPTLTISALLALLMLCGGCGGGGGPPTATTDPPVHVRPVSASAVAPPAQPAPQESGVSGKHPTPPPAWVSWRGHSAWLALGSFCYRTLCVDKILPEQRDDVPRLRIRAGDRVIFHFGVALREISVSRGNGIVRLRGARTATWTVPAGFSTLSVFGRFPSGGDVSYDALLGPARRASKR